MTIADIDYELGEILLSDGSRWQVEPDGLVMLGTWLPMNRIDITENASGAILHNLDRRSAVQASGVD